MSPFAQQSFLSIHNTSVRTRSFRAWLDAHRARVTGVLFVLLVALSLAYIIQVNNAASKGYAIRDLENAIHELTVANQQLEQSAREAQSLDHISHAVKMLGMVEAKQPVYVDAAAPSYALAK